MAVTQLQLTHLRLARGGYLSPAAPESPHVTAGTVDSMQSCQAHHSPDPRVDRWVGGAEKPEVVGEERSRGRQVVLEEGPDCLCGDAFPHDMGLLSSCALRGIKEIGDCPPTRASTPQADTVPPCPLQPTQ